MINDLLEVNREGHSGLSVQWEVCKVHQLIEEATARFSGSAEPAKLSLSFSETLAPDLRCDPEIVTQVIVNLLDQAIKVTPEDAAIP